MVCYKMDIQRGGVWIMTGDISKSTLQRLPVYLAYLRTIPPDGPEHISATALAAALGMGEVQVRKDLASVSDAGKPRVGYRVSDLVETLEQATGCGNLHSAVLVGAGNLGRALLSYGGFEQYGLRILAAFDREPLPGTASGLKQPVLPVSQLPHFCREHQVRIGILTVPAEAAQDCCDTLVNSGVQAVWNFAPVRLTAPPEVLIQNENMAASLALLSHHLSKRLTGPPDRETGGLEK